MGVLARSTIRWFSPVPPSIFGALPSSPPTSNSGFLTFYFTSFNPNVLNSVIVGPSRNYIDVATGPNNPESTVFTNSQGQTLAIIEWHRSPFVEIRDTVSRRMTSQFIPLSPDRSYRTMEFKGKRYAWVPNLLITLSLYVLPSKSSAPLVARVLRAADSVNLQITTNASTRALWKSASYRLFS
ncbi:hypothetical protein BDQ17DRAFT_1506072 [Cyathus striatus]|nr:hypothetical protein BDQ17DRAFT_1506072 [Cyathus striatus]